MQRALALLVDVNAEVQAAWLDQRGDDLRLLADHQAFADWMRGHARDPRDMSHVLSSGGWEAMRWERLRNFDPGNGGWAVHVVDTSELSSDELAEQVLSWCRRALRVQAASIHVASGGLR